MAVTLVCLCFLSRMKWWRLVCVRKQCSAVSEENSKTYLVVTSRRRQSSHSGCTNRERAWLHLLNSWELSQLDLGARRGLGRTKDPQPKIPAALEALAASARAWMLFLFYKQSTWPLTCVNGARRKQVVRGRGTETIVHSSPLSTHNYVW